MRRFTKVLVAPRAGVKHGDIGVDGLDEVPGLGLVAAELLLCVGKYAGVVVARAAGGLRVGGDYLDAGLREIIPVLYVLGISLPYEEDYG